MISGEDLIRLLPKKVLTPSVRRHRSTWRGPSLSSYSGWGALEITGANKIATDLEMEQMTKENVELGQVIDQLERKKMRLRQEYRDETEESSISPREQSLMSLTHDGADYSDRLDDILRGPSTQTRSGWGGIEEVSPWYLGSPRSPEMQHSSYRGSPRSPF